MLAYRSNCVLSKSPTKLASKFPTKLIPKLLPKLLPKFIQLSLAFGVGLTVLPQLSHAQNLPTLGDSVRQDLTPMMERKIGEQIMHGIRRDPDYIDDGPISEYLNKLGSVLLEKTPSARGEAKFDYEFFAVRDPVLNAFALPGGFIGFHTGLILSAQTESELASVMGHEIGHVSQRHIARMLSSQKQDSLIPLAALLLAVLAARSSPDAAMAMVVGGQGLAVSRQLSFSRDAEREADRIGFQILKEGGYDTTGMLAFFGRLQHASRNYTDNGMSYLSSHPVTSDRMADIQGRLQGERYKQRLDGLEFFLIQARARILQDSKEQGLIDASNWFDNQIKTGSEPMRLSARYGLAMVAMKRKKFQEAELQLKRLVDEIRANPKQKNYLEQTSAFVYLQAEIQIEDKRAAQAVQTINAAMEVLPTSRSLVYFYPKALIEAKQLSEAEAFLRDQISLYRSDAKLHHLLAQTYAETGQKALQHLSLAEAYALEGALPAAIAQLEIARTDKNVKHYELSVIDAREREWKEKHKQELLDEKKR